MKLLITGALGHIGSYFIQKIKPGEYTEILLIDNFLTQRYCSLFNLPERVPFRFLEADICTADLERLFRGVDVVLHLAAITDAARSFEFKDAIEKINFDGTEKVARACAKTGSKLIFLSTTSVYGTQETVVDEFCPADQLKPQSPYADSKIRSERQLSQLAETESLRFVCCRFGTIYGVSQGMRFHTAVNKFAWQACIGQPLSVWRTALHQRRPYLDLQDAASALRFIMKRDLFDRQTYNVLTENLTVNDLLEELRKLVPDLNVEFVDSQIMNQLSYTVKNDRFHALGFEFTGSYRRSLGEMVRLIRNARHI